MTVAKVWKLVRRPEGKPRVEDFALMEEEIPPLGEGGEFGLHNNEF